MIGAGMTLLLIGVGCIGGAIENGSGYLVSALILLIGYGLLWKGMLDEEREKNRKSRNRNRRDYLDFARYESECRKHGA